jgi:hypothetical protein
LALEQNEVCRKYFWLKRLQLDFQATMAELCNSNGFQKFHLAVNAWSNPGAVDDEVMLKSSTMILPGLPFC